HERKVRACSRQEEESRWPGRAFSWVSRSQFTGRVASGIGRRLWLLLSFHQPPVAIRFELLSVPVLFLLLLLVWPDHCNALDLLSLAQYEDQAPVARGLISA